MTPMTSLSDGVYATPREVANPADCLFYHTMDVPGYGTLQGSFDLRAGVQNYLGGVDLNNKRVLEMGTADGFLCYHMEGQGAEVVAYDLSEEHPWDIVPYARFSPEEREQLLAERRTSLRKLNSAFWFCHRAFQSRAKMVYGTIYTVPEAIGPVDITTFGAILLHVRDPFLALQNTLRLTKETVIITEAYLTGEFPQEFLANFPPPAKEKAAPQDVDFFTRARGPFSVFLPNFPTRTPWETWWYLSPDLIRQFIGVLGFERTEISYHYQDFAGGLRIPFYTIVGHRTA